jgi:hypothetical protein
VGNALIRPRAAIHVALDRRAKLIAIVPKQNLDSVQRCGAARDLHANVRSGPRERSVAYRREPGGPRPWWNVDWRRRALAHDACARGNRKADTYRRGRTMHGTWRDRDRIQLVVVVDDGPPVVTPFTEHIDRGNRAGEHDHRQAPIWRLIRSEHAPSRNSSSRSLGRIIHVLAGRHRDQRIPRILPVVVARVPECRTRRAERRRATAWRHD